jgi:histidinol-phosphatase
MFRREHAFAMALAEEAATISMGVFRGDVEVALKADLSPVTQADVQIEAMVRERIADAFPQDRVLGEEEGGDADAEAGGRLWIVDPIDGTANFARGIPVWATLIALQVDAEVVLGVAEASALGERYAAVRGEGARCNGEPIHVSQISKLPASQLLYGGMKTWLTDDRWKGVLDTLTGARRSRGFGDFWGHTLVARGSAEAMVEPDLNLWDYAALVPIVEEAGGRVTALDGGPLRHGGSVLSTNGVMHDELIRRFASLEG